MEKSATEEVIAVGGAVCKALLGAPADDFVGRREATLEGFVRKRIGREAGGGIIPGGGDVHEPPQEPFDIFIWILFDHVKGDSQRPPLQIFWHIALLFST